MADNKFDPKSNQQTEQQKRFGTEAEAKKADADAQKKTDAGRMEGTVKGAAVAQAKADEENRKAADEKYPDVTQETIDAQVKEKVDRMSEAQTGATQQPIRGQAIDPGAIPPLVPGDLGGTGASVGPLTGNPDEKTIEERRNPRPEPNSGQNPAG